MTVTRVHTRRADYCHHTHMAGIGMLEVLIALLIFSIGILGLAQLQGVATRQNHHGYLRSQASFLAFSITERMRSNPAHADDYVIEMAGSAPNGSSRAARDLKVWLSTLNALLPSGDGEIQKHGRIYTATVQYRVTAQYDDDDNDPASTVRVSIATEINS